MPNAINEAVIQKLNASERNRLLFIIAITTIIGMVAIPRDIVVAELAAKYIFPALASGLLFGVTFMTAIDLWKSTKTGEKNERNRMLFIIGVSASVGTLLMPHDTAVATIASKYIFPTVVAGMCFGIAFMAGIDLWKDSKKVAEPKASAKASA